MTALRLPPIPVGRLLASVRQEAVLLALLVALLLTAGHLSQAFLAAPAQAELSTHVWELALLALPMTLIILTAGIDLSVGSTMALSAVVFGLSFAHGFPVWADALLALLTGAAAGALNGVFIAYVRVHPLIVTLATLAAYRGIAEGISLGRPYSGFPAGFARLGQGTWLGLPIPGVLFLFVLLATAVLLARTPLGLRLSAIGYNETAARYSGWPSRGSRCGCTRRPG